MLPAAISAYKSTKPTADNGPDPMHFLLLSESRKKKKKKTIGTTAENRFLSIFARPPISYTASAMAPCQNGGHSTMFN